jgi:hypothetical protein
VVGADGNFEGDDLTSGEGGDDGTLEEVVRTREEGALRYQE